MRLTGVLAERDIFDVVQAIFDLRVSAFESCQLGRTAHCCRETCDTITHLLLGHILDRPSPDVLKHLRQIWPRTVACQFTRYPSVPFLSPPMAFFDRSVGLDLQWLDGMHTCTRPFFVGQWSKDVLNIHQ